MGCSNGGLPVAATGFSCHSCVTTFQLPEEHMRQMLGMEIAGYPDKGVGGTCTSEQLNGKPGPEEPPNSEAVAEKGKVPVDQGGCGSVGSTGAGASLPVCL